MTKSKKTTIICITAAIICAVCIFAYTQTVRASADEARNEALARYGGEQIEVCVAKRDINAGETIDSGAFEVKLWVADLLPDDAVRNPNDILGRQLTTSILSGEVISEKRFTDQAITFDVPYGLSALSVPAKEVSALGGALSAGMHVDVYVTGNTSTSLINRDVLVLATSSTNNQSTSSSAVTWVTLAVEPAMVQELVAASQSSSLYFVLPSETENNEKEESYDSNSKSSDKNNKDQSKSNINSKTYDENTINQNLDLFID